MVELTERIELTNEKLSTVEGIAELNRMLREIYDEIKSIDSRVTALEP